MPGNVVHSQYVFQAKSARTTLSVNQKILCLQLTVFAISSATTLTSSLRASCTNVVHDLGSAEPRSRVEPSSC